METLTKTALLASLLSVSLWTACSKNDADLVIDTDEELVLTNADGFTRMLRIESGNGKYQISSENGKIVKAGLFRDDNYVEITPVGCGTTTVSITDKNSGQRKNIWVEVVPAQFVLAGRWTPEYKSIIPGVVHPNRETMSEVVREAYDSELSLPLDCGYVPNISVLSKSYFQNVL